MTPLERDAKRVVRALRGRPLDKELIREVRRQQEGGKTSRVARAARAAQKPETFRVQIVKVRDD